MERTLLQARFGVVLFADVVRSRHRPARSAEWLEALTAELGARYREQTLAAFEFTQGDELQGLLRPDADPFTIVADATLRPRRETPEMRWAVVAGEVIQGRGPATRRSGPAFLTARRTIELARHQRDNLLVMTGDPDADGLLAGTAPVLGSLLTRLTDRQREVARLGLVEGMRQSEIADRLAVARATVSVAFARADVRSLARLLGAVREVWSEGIERMLADATDELADPIELGADTDDV